MSSRAAQRRAAGPKPRAEDAGAAIAPAPQPTGRAQILLLIGLVILTFWPVCTHDFTSWDDTDNVTENPHLNPPTLQGLRVFWSQAYKQEYIPLSYSAWWGLARVARLDQPDPSGVWLDPYVFHAANLLLHVGAALAAYQLLAALTRRRWAAWAGAVLFAVHPLQVEAVAWVTGLKDVLCGLLSLVALWQYVRFAQIANASGEDPAIAAGSRPWAHYSCATVALLLSLLAKPSAVSVPVLAGIIDGILVKRPWRRVVAALLPWAVIACGFVLVGLRSQAGLGAPATAPWARPLIAADALAFYTYKLVAPVRLGILYARSPQLVISRGWIWFTWVVPAALLVVAWASRRRVPWGLAAVLVLFAAPAAVLGLAPFDYQRYSTVADRYLYVGMLGPALALAFGLASATRSRRAAWLARGMVAVMLALFAGQALAQTTVWQNSYTLFRHALVVNPDSDAAYRCVANNALDAGRLDEAERMARESVRTGPNEAQNYVTLGLILQQLGRHAEAGVAFLQASQLDPADPTAVMNLAIELAGAGQVEKAVSVCRGVLRFHPELAEAHRCMATLLALQRREPDAVAEAEQSVRLAPDSVRARITLGQMLERVGRRAEAAGQFAAALSMAPNSVEARDGLARTGGAAPQPSQAGIPTR